MKSKKKIIITNGIWQNSTNLIRHLLLHHTRKRRFVLGHTTAQTQPITSFTMPKKLPLSDPKSKRVAACIVKTIINDLRPANLVEGSGFVELMALMILWLNCQWRDAYFPLALRYLFLTNYSVVGHFLSNYVDNVFETCVSHSIFNRKQTQSFSTFWQCFICNNSAVTYVKSCEISQ